MPWDQSGFGRAFRLGIVVGEYLGRFWMIPIVYRGLHLEGLSRGFYRARAVGFPKLRSQGRILQVGASETP